MANKHKKAKLFLFTYAYPYGNAESFLVNEIPFIAQAFSEVIVVPEITEGAPREMPTNFKVLTYERTKVFHLKKSIFAHGIFSIRVWLQSVYRAKEPKERMFYYRRWKIRLLDLMLELYNALRLTNLLKENGLEPNDIIYTYWMLGNARMLSWAKQCNWFNNRLVTRIHGFDFRFEQHPKGFFPYRGVELKGYDCIAAVSDYARQYILDHYSVNANKLKTYRLGVKHIEVNQDRHLKQDGFVFLSCSYLIPRKRVHWIHKAITDCAKLNRQEKLTWYHIGDGISSEALEKKVEQSSVSNLSIHLLGGKSNTEIVEFYKRNYIDAFIHCAEGEGGCAVAIQEAFSAGVPLIGIANGGVIEMLNEKNSIALIGNDGVTYKTLQQCLESFISLSEDKRNEMRLAAKNSWQKMFSAEDNFKRFISNELS